MTTNNWGRAPIKNATPSTTDARNHSKTDPLIGWHSLAKPLLDREKKNGKRKGVRR